MLALAGYPLGLEFLFFDPSAECCAEPVGELIRADYDDQAALADFCERIDVASFEFENVPQSAAEFVAARRALRPGFAVLGTAQDRLNEKNLFESLGIPVPGFAAVDSRSALDQALSLLGFPAVLKTRRMGYDGKGQAVLRSPDDVETAWSRLGGQPLILERFVAFERELSCLTVRGSDGTIAHYPVVENVHRSGILHTASPRADDPLQGLAEDYSRRIVEHFDYVGVLAFEFFAVGAQLLANEIAPRVHNSGHWSIEAAVCSQFENHLRAVCGLPLGSTALRQHSLMLNCIGTEPAPEQILAINGAHLHRYGKTPKPLRKLAHITLCADDAATLDGLRLRVEPLLPG